MRRAAGCLRGARVAGQPDRDDVQAAVEKVLAELGADGGAAQVFLGWRRPHAQVELRTSLLPSISGVIWRDSATQAQQLDLDGERHAFDLVEEQGAAAGVFDAADGVFVRRGKRRARGRRVRFR